MLRYGQDPELFCLLRLAHTLWLLGRGEEADRRRDDALALADASAHPYSRAALMLWAAILALDQCDEERFRHHVAALEAAADAHSPRPIRYALEAFGGYVDVLDDRSEEGIAHVRHALDDTSADDAPAPGTPGILAHTLLAACSQAGAAEAGLAAADAALGTGRGAELWEAEMRRLRAQFLAATGAPNDEIEAELRRAIAVAEAQGARTFELRARDRIGEAAIGNHDVSQHVRRDRHIGEYLIVRWLRKRELQQADRLSAVGDGATRTCHPPCFDDDGLARKRAAVWRAHQEDPLGRLTPLRPQSGIALGVTEADERAAAVVRDQE